MVARAEHVLTQVNPAGPDVYSLAKLVPVPVGVPRMKYPAKFGVGSAVSSLVIVNGDGGEGKSIPELSTVKKIVDIEGRFLVNILDCRRNIRRFSPFFLC